MKKIRSGLKVAALLGVVLSGCLPAIAQTHKSIPLDAGGWFSGFAVNQTTGRLYGYGDVFGAWRSDNNGDTWKFLNNTIVGRINPNSGNVSIDHFLQGIAVGSDPDKVVFRTPDRLYISTNGGDSWTAAMTDLTDSGLYRSATPIVYRPGNDQEIWVAGNRTTGGRLWRSDNGGANWTRMDTGVLADKNVVTLYCHPSYPNQMWAGADGGLYVSINTDGTWGSWTHAWGSGVLVTGVSGSRNGLPVRVKSIARHTATGIGWLATDAGGFRVTATDWSNPATYSVQGPIVSSYGGFGPDSGSVLKDSRGQGGEVFVSTRQYPLDQLISYDAGASWVSYPMTLWMPPQPIWGDPSTSGKRLDSTDQIVQDPFNNSRWFATNGKSPVVSTDAGVNWTYVPNNGGVASVVTWKVNFAAENQNVALIPGADKGAFVVTDQGSSGTAAYCSNPSFNVLTTVHEVMSSKDGQTLVAAGVEQAVNKNRIIKSTNGGKNWVNLDLSGTGLPLSSEGIVRAVMNPNDPDDYLVLLATGGTNSNPGLWRTTNGGTSFSQVLSGLPDTGSRNHTGAVYMEADSKEPNRRYLVVRTNLYRSVDNGQSWSGATQPLGNAWVQAFSADDQVAGKLWAGNRYGLRKSTNYGDSWTPVPGFTWCLAVDAVDGRVAVWGTRTGDTWPKIYYSSNDGANWIEASGVGHRYAWTRELAVDPWEAGKIWVSGISANVISGLPSTAPNTAPVITTAAIDKQSPKTNEVLTATPSTVNTAGSSDAEGHALTFSYVWKKGATVLSATGPTLDLSVAGNGDRGDSITVTVTATETGTNPALSSQPVTSSAVIVQNSAPLVDSVSISPGEPSSASLLTANVVASDADRDAFALSYQWQRNNVTLVGETKATLDLSKQGNVAKGDTITVVVTATETGGTTPLASEPKSNSVTIGNVAPSVVSVLPQNTTDTVGASRTFSLAVRDSDGASDIREMWLLINAQLDWSAGATLVYFPKSGQLYLRNGDSFGAPILIGAAAGANDILDNGGLRIVGSEVSVVADADGKTLTLSIPATVREGMVGVNTLFGRVQDEAGEVDAASIAGEFGFVRFGPYTVKPQFQSGTNRIPTLLVPSPEAANTVIPTTGANLQTFVFYVADEDGVGDLDSLWFAAGTTRDWSLNATFVFLPRTRRLYLRSGDGQSFIGGGVVGSAGTIENSRVKVDLSQVQYLIHADGKNAELRLPLQPKAGLLGQNNIWLRVQDNAGTTSTGSDELGYVQSGTWNVTQQSNSTINSAAPSVPGS